YLFLTEKHREALAHLVYGIEQRRGFIVITGEVGTGKTTICRSLLTQFGEDTRIALVLNPMLSEVELLESILNEFYISIAEHTKKSLLEQLDAFLIQQHSQGRNVVLVIDEAQNLPLETLEQIRIISNLETEKVKLIQIVLLGQPELSEKLASPQLRQLEQRVSVRFHLTPLTEEETREYIQHRIMVAGGQGTIHFDAQALKFISDKTQGIPRKINVLCDRALLVAFVEGAGRITEAIVKQAFGEIQSERPSRKTLSKAKSAEPDLSILGKAAPLDSPRVNLLRTVVVLILILLVALLGVNFWLVLTVRDLSRPNVVSHADSLEALSDSEPAIESGNKSDDRLESTVKDTAIPSTEIPEVSSLNESAVPDTLAAQVQIGEATPELPQPHLVQDQTSESLLSPKGELDGEVLEEPTSEPVRVQATALPEPVSASAERAIATGEEVFDSEGVFRAHRPESAPWAVRATLCRVWDASEEQLAEAFKQASLQSSATPFLALQNGFVEESFVLDATRVRGIGIPCILWSDTEEPAVLLSVQDDQATLAWASLGKFKTKWGELLTDWSGNVTYIVPKSWRLEENWRPGVDASKAIFRMQNALREMGYFSYTPNGNYGSKTEEAVRRFQADRGLTPDGIVGQETYIALKSAMELGVPHLSRADTQETERTP
ncbi:MAG TPA: AAA family ATPase, partial [bacterium]|nr:AAA family ATPase [bacterium]